MSPDARNNEIFTLAQELPELSVELQKLLKEAGEPALAASVPQLPIVDRCRCGDDFCATFYVQAKPEGVWGTEHESIPLDPEQGMIIVDVLKNRIACIEVLDRDAVRQKLLALFP